MNTNEALYELAELKYAILKAEHDLAATVAEARTNGASWSDIGGYLGMSKQAAQQKFGDALPNTYRCNCGWSHIIPANPERCTAETDVVLTHIKTEHPDLTAVTAAKPVATPPANGETP